MKEDFEVVTGRDVVKVTKHTDGETTKFFGETGYSGGPIAIDHYTEDLCDVLHCSLRPLSNLRRVLKEANGGDDSDLSALLDHLVWEAYAGIEKTCDSIEKRIGKIIVKRTDCLCWGMQEGFVLDAEIKKPDQVESCKCRIA